MLKKLACGASLICVALMANASDEPRSLMGIELGKPFSADALPSCAGYTGDSLCAKEIKPPVVLLGSVPLKDLHPTALLLLSAGGVAQELAFSGSSASYSSVKLVFEERFGKPTGSESGIAENRLGAKFDQEIATWEWSNLKIVMTKRTARNLDEMSLRVFDKELDAARMKKRTDSLKSEASKL